MSIVCKFLGHNWHDCNYWNDTLKVNIPRRVCLRCGARNIDYEIKEYNYYKNHTCPKCGAWVCSSGVCVYCDKDI